MLNLEGQSIGRYHIIERLGEGGMAVVYRAYDTHLDCDVAIKFIRTDMLAVGELEIALKRFQTEAHKMARLTHPNIVRVIDYGEHQGTPYLVMVYLTGGTLKQKLGSPLPCPDVARLLAPIARALEYAHQQGIIHRDVKPANILLTDTGQPMLSDFGVAKVLTSEGERSGHLTGTGVGIGTPEYMAPEQVMGLPIDHRVDIYSLGVVLFELATGRRPFIADTPMAVAIKHVSDPLPRPKDLKPDLPDDIERILFKAMAKNPADRYQSMAEFAIDLEKLTGSQSPAASGSQVLGTAERLQRLEVLDQQARSAIRAGRWDQARVFLQETLHLDPTNRNANALLERANTEIARQQSQVQIPVPSRAAAVPEAAAKPRPFGWWWIPIMGGILLVGVMILAFLVWGTLTAINSRNAQRQASAVAMNAIQTAQAQARILSLTPPAPEATLTPMPTETQPEPTSSPTLATPTPQPVIGSTFISPLDGMELVYVPAGEFLMGSTENDSLAEAIEKPQHKVYLDAFWIDRTEVTNDLFSKFIGATNFRTNAEKEGWGWIYNFTSQKWEQVNGADWQHPRGPSTDISGRSNYPVVQVSWDDAVAYCQWAKRRLPTEAEWEKAARGVNGGTFPWGAGANCQRANYWGKEGGCVADTSQVGSLPDGASPYGALDMAGNVFEWVADWYSETYYQNSPLRNPLGPDTGQYHVLRGGSWLNVMSNIRSAYRTEGESTYRFEALGFRCALSAQ